MHPHIGSAIVAALTMIVVTLGYALACAVWPFTACRRCDGNGKHRSPSGRAWRYCRACNGTGARLRTGRKVFNLIRRLYTDGR